MSRDIVPRSGRSVHRLVVAARNIAGEAQGRFGISRARPRWTDTAAVILVLVGGFTIIGWVVGVVLLWISDAWSTRDKIIGTLVVPFGLAGGLGAAFLMPATSGSCEVTGSAANGIGSCVSDPSPFGGAVGLILGSRLVIAPIVTAVHLGRKLRRGHAASD